MKDFFDELNGYRVKVEKDGKEIVNMPGILALPGLLVAPKASIIGMIAAPLLGCSIHLENEKGKVTIEFQDLPDKYTDGKIVISDDCSVAEAPAAEDVLNMSQDDLTKLGRIIYQLMYGY